jgi:DNA-binding transcriptional ArsR family regulator
LLNGQEDRLDGVFDALANEHRRAIMHALSLQPRSISQLASMRGLSLPAIHKHILVLEGAALVIRKKVGRTNFLALNREPLRGLQEWVGGFNPYWGNEKETLENYARYLGTSQPPEEGQK